MLIVRWSPSIISTYRIHSVVCSHARSMETDASRTFNFKLLLCLNRRWLRHEFFSLSLISIHFISTAYWIVLHISTILLCGLCRAWDRKGPMRWDCIIKTVFIFRSKLIINNKFIRHFLCLCRPRPTLSLSYTHKLSSFFCCSIINAEHAVATSECERWKDITRSSHSPFSSSYNSPPAKNPYPSNKRPANRVYVLPYTFDYDLC